MKQVLVPLLTLLLLASSGVYYYQFGNQEQVEQSNYTHYQVEIEWPGSVCKFKNCNSRDLKDFDGTHFNLHGVWPTGLPDSQCTYLQNCQRIPYDPSLVEPELEKELDQYWTGLYNPTDDFRKHEWEKHGTCWNDDSQGQNLKISTAKYINDYFQMCLGVIKRFDPFSLWKQQNVVPSEQQSYDYDEVMELLRPHFGEGLLGVCQKVEGKSYLHSLDFCLGLNYEPIKCLCGKKKTNCPQKIYIGEFEAQLLSIQQ